MWKKLKLIIGVLVVLLLHDNFCLAYWKTYTTFNSELANDTIFSIDIDTAGYIWFGTNDGASRFDSKSNWETYNKLNSGITHNEIRAITVGKISGNIWFGTTSNSVSMFNGVVWSSCTLKSIYVYDIAIDNSENIWFATLEKGVSKYNLSADTWTIYDSGNSCLVYNQVRCIAIDKNGNKWFGTHGHGISKFNENEKQWTTYDIDDGLISNWVNDITIDKNGNKWIGTEYGVSVLNANENKWLTYKNSNSGLLDNHIRAIAIDDFSGDIWFGTQGGGITKFDGNSWTTYTVENSELINDFINSIIVDSQRNKWIGTIEGVSVFLEKDVNTPKGEVKIQGGVKGYVNPSLGEGAKIHFNTIEQGKVTATIYTLNGHLVWKKTILANPGKDFIMWDCKNNDKTVVSSGVYIVYVEGPGINSIKKVAIIK